MPADIYNDGSYASKNPEWHSRESHWKARHLLSLLKDDLCEGHIDPETIAEIGCGYGGVLVSLRDQLAAIGLFLQATGFDISRQAIAEACRRHANVEFVCLNALDDERKFGLGLLVDVLEHMSDPFEFLKRIRGRFSYLLVHLPLDRNWLGEHMRPGTYYDYLKNDRGHLHYFDKNSGLELLTRAGFEVLRWKYTFWGKELYQPTPAAGRSAGIIRVLRGIGMTLAPNVSVRLLGGASLAVLARSRQPTFSSSDK